ncbi:hypothetical protein [Geminisphaera colitermitum]|uniref:hypothetical protein n=1 Tax=Geminisphaera colitermitum TaxID=1148786 RepID=UPI000158C960|nr:hypothetical protein [Geminisphaera colitermitum]
MSEITRKGKIARLPLAIREEVNHRLMNGEPASKILPWLNNQEAVLRVLDEHFGEEPVTPQNLSEWRQGGYADWCEKREKVSHLKELSSYAAKLGKAAGGDLTEGGAAILSGKILEAIEASGPDDLGALTKSLVALRGTDLEARKSRQRERLLDQRERQVALSEKQFQVKTCEAFLKFYADKKAAEIADSKSKPSVKVEQLRLLMFGETEATGGGNE